MNFAVILLVCNGRGGSAEAQSIKFNSFEQLGVKTLVQARNVYIKASRKVWREQADWGDGSAVEAVGHIKTHKPYAAFAWEDDSAATILVPENTPYYDCIKHLHVELVPTLMPEEEILACFNEDEDRAENLWQEALV